MSVETNRQDLIKAEEMRLERYLRLVALAEEERQVLISGKHDQLTENLAKQDEVLAEISNLDKRIKSLTEQLAVAEPSAEFNARLEAVRSKATEVALLLRSLIDTNRVLLDNALRFVSFTLAAISNTVMQQRTYDMNRTASEERLSVILDQKV